MRRGSNAPHMFLGYDIVERIFMIINTHVHRSGQKVPERNRACRIVAVLLLLAVSSVLISCMIGSVTLSWSDIGMAGQELLHGTVSTMATTLVELRLGRALSAFVTGSTLALAGVMMQALLRNPLADPYVLGVSGGAAVGALGAMLLFSLSWLVDAAAFGGAMAIAFLLYFLARRDLRGAAHSD